jgi:hypothetical protein
MSADATLPWERPLRAGLPVATSRARVGCLGAVVFDRASGDPLLLGAEHVLADPRGDGRVWQPYPCGDRGCDCNLVGRILRSRRSVISWQGHWYYVDAAVAALEPGVEWSCASPRAAAEPRKGGRVHKTGPATGRTEGCIIDDHHVERIRLGFAKIDVPNQLRIQPTGDHRRFAADGDSGAVVCDEDGRAVGLVWGADETGRAVACPIGAVLEAMLATFAMEES